MRRFNHESGFTLVELMVAVAIMGTMAAMAILLTPNFRRQASADSGVVQAMNALRTARELAVSQRRNIQVNFVAPNRIQVIRQPIPPPIAIGDMAVLLNTFYLEGAMEFRQFLGQGDTPDAFGATAAVAFGASAQRMFTSQGTFVDANGQPLNGTVFVGRLNEPASARAITVFGPTALIRVWRWDGTRWVE